MAYKGAPAPLGATITGVVPSLVSAGGAVAQVSLLPISLCSALSGLNEPRALVSRPRSLSLCPLSPLPTLQIHGLQKARVPVFGGAGVRPPLVSNPASSGLNVNLGYGGVVAGSMQGQVGYPRGQYAPLAAGKVTVLRPPAGQQSVGVMPTVSSLVQPPRAQYTGGIQVRHKQLSFNWLGWFSHPDMVGHMSLFLALGSHSLFALLCR